MSNGQVQEFGDEKGTVLYRKEGEVAIVTFNRPEKLNTWFFYGGCRDGLFKALDVADNDDDVKVVIINGKGRAFCAGHDLSEVGYAYGYGTGKHGEVQPERPNQRVRLKVDTFQAYEHFARLFYYPKITIASVHGLALGHGMYICEMCDFIVASEDAVFAHYGQRLGFAGGGGGPILTTVLKVGMNRARELRLLGRELSAREAHEWGLVNSVVPREKLDEEAMRYAKLACLQPADGLRIGKLAWLQTFDTLGIHADFTYAPVGHTLMTNLRFKPNEFNFFKVRRDKGVREAVHEMHKRYADLGMSIADAREKTDAGEK
ncbi:MAG: enoyl-CoA hydratase/isomerase family protein [Chloroflexi bacterium]|nr:enoyl-CoA hydratase/isomerase family protein [Chloroflexota bacterium]